MASNSEQISHLAAPAASSLSEPPRKLATLPAELRLHIYSSLMPPGSTVIVPCMPPQPPEEDEPSQTGNRRHSLWRRRPRQYSMPSSSRKPSRCGPAYCLIRALAHLVQPDGIHSVLPSHNRGCACCCNNEGCLRRADEDESWVEGPVLTLRAVLALMGTCRLFYAEVAEMFYGRVIFRVLWSEFPFRESPALLRLLRDVRRLRLVWDGWGGWPRWGDPWKVDVDLRGEHIANVEAPRVREFAVECPRGPELLSVARYLLGHLLPICGMPDVSVLQFIPRPAPAWLWCPKSGEELLLQLNALGVYTTRSVAIDVVAPADVEPPPQDQPQPGVQVNPGTAGAVSATSGTGHRMAAAIKIPVSALCSRFSPLTRRPPEADES
jgi:hypothetical protein